MSGPRYSASATCSPVPVVGIGCITAAGIDLNSTVETMLAGFRRPLPPPLLTGPHDTDYPVFSIPEPWLEGKLAGMPRCERCCELAWLAAREALESAGIDDACLAGRRVGICLGTVAGAALEDFSFHRAFRAGGRPSVAPVMEFIRSDPADRLRTMLSAQGPTMTVTTACTSGAQAIIQAADWIRQGVCDIVLAGGTEKISRMTYSGFISLRITDAEACRPFDKNRRGLNLGEGAGVVVLENGDSLKERSGQPLAWLAGSGNGCDAWHLSRPIASGRGLRRAIEEALRESGLTASEIAFVNAHGTATPDNDLVEGRLLASMLPGVPFYSSKAYTGHTLGAAGGIEAVLTIDGLLRQTIPGTAGYSDKDPEIGCEPTRRPLNCPAAGAALSTSVAYGGNNTALLFINNSMKCSK